MPRFRNQAPYFTTARFVSTCAETGRKIAKGEAIAYYPATRSVYCAESKQAAELRGLQFSSAFGLADAEW